jgi:hypothetical protein
LSAKAAVGFAFGAATLAAAPFGATQPLPEAPVAALVARAEGLALPHSMGTVAIDGRLGDSIWQDALVVELDVQTFPGENVPPPVETRAYIVEDGARLLIAFDARDPDPSAIRAYFRDRDAGWNDDFVGVVLDTFGDRRYGYEFFANALGVQMDATNDDVNGREDDSWDAIWESAGQINEQGFVVEMAIPFSQLRFPRTEEERLWGVDVLRFRPRTDRVRMSNNPLERGRNCYLCQFEQMQGPQGVAQKKNLELVPSLTAERNDNRPNPTVDPWQEGDAEGELGLNVRWALTQDLTANLALNPDFSQVEADVPQLEVNTQFALLYPESRPFFLEGSDYFSTPIQAVFTRTVSDPDFGAKLTGQSNQSSFGVFAAEDAVTNLLFPTSLASSTTSLDMTNRALVGRYARNVGRSTVGALVTSRSGDDYHNDVAGIDGRIRVSDRHSLRFQALRSDTQYPAATAAEFAQPAEAFAGDALQVRYTFSHRNWFADLTHKNFEGSFRADSGFVPRVDMDQQMLESARIWQRPGSKWNQIRVGLNGTTTDDGAGQLLDRTLEPFVSFQGPMQSYIQLGGGPLKRYWDGQLHSGHHVVLISNFKPRGGLSINVFARDGDQLDLANSRLGEELRVRPTIEWNVNRHLLLRLQHTAARLDTAGGERIFKADLTDLRVTWQFNLRSFVRFTSQRQLVRRNVAVYIDPSTESETLTLGTQLLYSYKLNPQTVLFVGYSDNAREDDELADLTRTDRTVFAKLSYAWLR